MHQFLLNRRINNKINKVILILIIHYINNWTTFAINKRHPKLWLQFLNSKKILILNFRFLREAFF